MAVAGLRRCRLPHLPSNPEGTRVTLAAAQATSDVSCSLPLPRPALDCTSSPFISDPRGQGKRWGSLVRKILLLPRDTTTAVLAAGQGWLQCHLQGCSGGSSPGWGPAPLLLPQHIPAPPAGLTDSSLLHVPAALAWDTRDTQCHVTAAAQAQVCPVGPWRAAPAGPAPGYPTGLDPRCCPGVRSPGMSVACGCSGFSEAPGAVLGSEFSITDLS